MPYSIQQIYSKYVECKQKISTDSRNIIPGSMFFALKGNNFNGNKYAKEALEKGACIGIVDEKDYYIEGEMFLVEDVLHTLQQLACYHRTQLDIPIIAIAGSNGKTTTKELLYAVLSTQYNTFATRGNLNNHIGLPLSVLSIKKEHEIAVIEMGANHPGEIKQLSEIAQPEYGIITNIGKEHLEGFKNLEGVKKANGELFDYLSDKNGKAFVNVDDLDIIDISKNIRGIIGYGTKEEAYCQGILKQSFPFVTLEYQMGKASVLVQSQLPGKYNFENILASICIGKYFEISDDNIVKAIKNYVPANNRSQLIRQGTNTYILDAYNANPSSMKAAIESFLEMDGERKIVILGDMLEIGEESYKEHLETTSLLKDKKLDQIYLVGKEFEKVKNNIDCKHFDDVNSLKKFLQKQKYNNTQFLIKGSRLMKLELLLND